MSVEITQLVVKTSISDEAEGGEPRQGKGCESCDLEALKKEILDACRKMIAESQKDRGER